MAIFTPRVLPHATLAHGPAAPRRPLATHPCAAALRSRTTPHRCSPSRALAPQHPPSRCCMRAHVAIPRPAALCCPPVPSVAAPPCPSARPPAPILTLSSRVVVTRRDRQCRLHVALCHPRCPAPSLGRPVLCRRAVTPFWRRRHHAFSLGVPRHRATISTPSRRHRVP
ncbi:hypothetical protein DENSPDRAFT_882115 [Dentipellis sp. KUC8613]|nr:hypothetical protein DENSPDRAFT_882115 [Dentipellis sp. KUC8613]